MPDREPGYPCRRDLRTEINGTRTSGGRRLRPSARATLVTDRGPTVQRRTITMPGRASISLAFHLKGGGSSDLDPHCARREGRVTTARPISLSDAAQDPLCPECPLSPGGRGRRLRS